MKTKISFLLYTIIVFNTSTSAQNTYIPDDNFEQHLIDYGYDSGPLDDYVPTANINTITSLQLAAKNIADLTGIEDFIALEELHCQYNQITTLDLSNNINLQTLYCYYNQLVNINLSANIALEYLDCSNNQLSTIDLSANIALEHLECYNNQFTAIDLSANTALKNLFCSNNQLTTIDVSANTALEYLACATNQLVTIDVSANTILRWLYCHHNQLTSLNVANGNNTNFVTFHATNNPNLFCIQVDDATWSSDNWTNIDTQSSFNNNCSLSTEDVVLKNSFSIYPNPVKSIININNINGKFIESFSLYSITGKHLVQQKVEDNLTENTIDISRLPEGVYFLKIITNKGIFTQKVIKKGAHSR